MLFASSGLLAEISKNRQERHLMRLFGKHFGKVSLFQASFRICFFFLLILLHLLDQSSVFDFYVKIDHSSTRFENWEVAVPKFAYDNRLSFSEILVPTIDTVRFSALLRMCLEVEKPVLFTGRILTACYLAFSISFIMALQEWQVLGKRRL